MTSALNETPAPFFQDTYNHPVIYITENGFSQSDPAPMDDGPRWEYFRLTLREILKGTDCANLIQLSYAPIRIEAKGKWFFKLMYIRRAAGQLGRDSLRRRIGKRSSSDPLYHDIWEA